MKRKILINSGFSSSISLKSQQNKAGLLRSRLYFCRCAIAIDPKVLYRFEVRVCEEIFAKAWFRRARPVRRNQKFLLSVKEKNIPKKSFN